MNEEQLLNTYQQMTGQQNVYNTYDYTMFLERLKQIEIQDLGPYNLIESNINERLLLHNIISQLNESRRSEYIKNQERLENYRKIEEHKIFQTMYILNKSEKKKMIDDFTDLIDETISYDKASFHKKRKYYLDDECVVINKFYKNKIVSPEKEDINEIDIDINKPLIDMLLNMKYFESNDAHYPI